MKVILLSKVNNLGQLGDVVEVKNGFAMNYLFPKAIAQRFTEENFRTFSQKKEEYAKSQNDWLQSAQVRHEAINNVILTISAKASLDGKLFGSVSAPEIIKAAKAQGVELKKSEIKSNQHLKNLGVFEIGLSLHPELNTAVKVNIIPSQE